MHVSSKRSANMDSASDYGAATVLDVGAKARFELETVAQWLGPKMARAVGKLALRFSEEWGDGKPCGPWEAIEAIVRDRLLEEGLLEAS